MITGETGGEKKEARPDKPGLHLLISHKLQGSIRRNPKDHRTISFPEGKESFLLHHVAEDLGDVAEGEFLIGHLDGVMEGR